MTKTFLNHWQLGSILGSALGLPAIIIGGQVASKYGAGTAISSVFIGNMILWAMGMGIISMGKHENHTVQNVIKYLGKGGGIIVSIIVIIAFLSWYAIQIEGLEISLTSFAPSSIVWNNMFGIKIGIALGLMCSFLSAWNIRIIKWLCVISLPLLLSFAIFKVIVVSINNPINLKGTWGISFAGILFIITSWLPGTVNLSTFFRHASSKESKILGLSLMTFFHMTFQIAAVLCSIDSLSSIFKDIYSTFQQCLAIGFAVLSFFCINLVNIYFASVGWETFTHGHKGVLNYIATGFLGTLFYIFLPNLRWVTPVEVAIASFVITLGIILLLMFLMNDIVKPNLHYKSGMEKVLATICWLTGCAVAVAAQTFSSSSSYPVIFGGIATFISFLIVIFFQETIQSIKTIMKINSKNI